MAIIDKRVHRFAAFARKPIVFSIASIGINQAGTVGAWVNPYQGFPAGQPPYAIFGYFVERVEVFCTAIVATATVDLQSSTSGAVLAGLLNGPVTPVAGTVVVAVLAPPASRRVPLTSAGLVSGIRVLQNTNGTGTITNLMVTVTIRPFPMADEAA